MAKLYTSFYCFPLWTSTYIGKPLSCLLLQNRTEQKTLATFWAQIGFFYFSCGLIEKKLHLLQEKTQKKDQKSGAFSFPRNILSLFVFFTSSFSENKGDFTRRVSLKLAKVFLNCFLSLNQQHLKNVGSYLQNVNFPFLASISSFLPSKADTKDAMHIKDPQRGHHIFTDLKKGLFLPPRIPFICIYIPGQMYPLLLGTWPTVNSNMPTQATGNYWKHWP